MTEPALNCENNMAIFKQNYTIKLFIAFKMAYSCSFRLRENLAKNLDFPTIKKLNKVCSNV